MFKTALKSLSGTLIKTAKDTVADFSPSPENIIHGVFDRLAQQGIANLSYRSPILSSLAQVAMDNFQREVGKKKYVSEYVNSKNADWLRENVKGKMGESATDKEVTSEMKSIITKITDAIEAEGVENVKKAGMFKEYEKLFEEYSKERKEHPIGHGEHPTGTTTASGARVSNDQTLINIEANTKELVDILKSGSTRNGYTEPEQYANDDRVPRTGSMNNSSKFIDPLTGMPSINAAVGSIGGDLLSRVFDDDALTKISNRIKNFMHPGSVPVDTEEKAKPEVRPSTTDSLKTVSETINTPEATQKKERDIQALQLTTLEKLFDVSEDIRDEVKKLNSSAPKIQPIKTDIKSVLKGGKEKAGISRTFIPKKAVPVKPDSVKDALADGKDKDKVPESSGGFFSSLLDIGSTALEYGAYGYLGKKALPLLGRAAPMIASVAGTVGAGALGVAGVGAFGVGGYAAGTVGNKYLTDYISDKTGVENNTLGSWIYDQFNPAKKEDTPFKYTGPAIPKPATAVAQLTELKQVSDSISKEANTQNQGTSQVVLNNQIMNSSGQSPQISGPRGSVRNIENTFERVQMQDFWPRSI